MIFLLLQDCDSQRIPLLENINEGCVICGMKNFDSLRDLDAHIEQHYRGNTVLLIFYTYSSTDMICFNLYARVHWKIIYQFITPILLMTIHLL